MAWRFQSPCRINSAVGLAGVLGLILGSGCCTPKDPASGGLTPVASASKPTPPETASPPSSAEEWVEGKLVHLQLEGGFWGLITPAGEKLRLSKPPPAEWQGGESVRVRLKRLEDGPSIFQWGRPVEWLAIERATKRQDA